ncbi:hypothetical protein RND71_005055 [Anisodus tanguticus]|uniref:O-fucosyltransferase family protein n=1 Tax=Anisodus tanguticus TaxID=243964 RepID=A0AAE1VL51_9SOLA|nr:hypothetical protein RND71_005055 [Anisodus tanguticus]
MSLLHAWKKKKMMMMSITQQMNQSKRIFPGNKGNASARKKESNGTVYFTAEVQKHLSESSENTAIDTATFPKEDIQGRRRLNDGWKVFVVDNNIKRWCVLKFELLEVTPDVVVFDIKIILKKKRPWRKKLLILRKFVTCAFGAITFVALLYVHVHVPSTDNTKFPDKLPKQHKISYQRLSRERSLTQEFAPPHLSKTPVTATKVIRAAKSDSRLANNNLPPDFQKLHCCACYQALRFKPPIEAMAKRAKGYCPLTPTEVGLFLSALGFTLNTPVYIAAGEIYGGDAHMSDLQSRYPLLLNKEKLASDEELEPFKKHASRLAAIDYIVSVESDIFIPSYSGNMARAVEGHRRFLGHRKTISPDRQDLFFLNMHYQHLGSLHQRQFAELNHRIKDERLFITPSQSLMVKKALLIMSI